MTKRWNTYRIAQVGLLFGVAYALIRYVFEQGWPHADEIIYFISYLFGGAIGGAILFAVVSGARNLILRAK